MSQSVESGTAKGSSFCLLVVIVKVVSGDEEGKSLLDDATVSVLCWRDGAFRVEWILRMSWDARQSRVITHNISGTTLR